VDYEAHVAAVEGAVAELVAAFASGPLDARVPSCPDWSLGDLADHVGGFAIAWTHVLCEGTGNPKPSFDTRDPGVDAAMWFGPIGDGLVRELRAATPDLHVWTWVRDQQNAAFVARRSAHELAVHRFDAQLARGTPAPLDGELAADGIEEIFVMIEAWREREHSAASSGYGRGSGETLHLHATDRPAEWLILLDPDALRVRREHAKGDLAVRASVSDLELTLYQRPTVGPVERFGDEGALAAWYRAFTFG
jgi:uncharacterized protein (TIGR03083 family)